MSNGEMKVPLRELVALGVSVTIATAGIVIGILWGVGDGLVRETREYRQRMEDRFDDLLRETAVIRERTRRLEYSRGATEAMVLSAFTPVVAAAAQERWRGLVVQPENRCAPYDRDDYRYPQSRELDIQDELGPTAGGWYGLYEARMFASRGETDIEHIVATSEAHDSGLCGRPRAVKRRFANDLNNLTIASPQMNRSEKSGKDAGEWLPPNARCWFARTVVFVKQTYDLSVDRRERDELERVLSACQQGVVPPRGGGSDERPPARPR